MSNETSAAETPDQAFPVKGALADHAHVNRPEFERLTAAARENELDFWDQIGQRLDWMRPYSRERIKDVSFDLEDLHIRWYDDGTLNASANCLDRHLATRGNQTAILWEGDDPAQSEAISYRQLHARVNRFANVLKRHGVKRGDRVAMYLPMIPDAAVAMLACARIGAIHSVIFGGFSPGAVAGRVVDCDAQVIITADAGRRGGRTTALKANVDKALENPEAAARVRSVLVINNTGEEVDWHEGRDHWLHEELPRVEAHCPPEEMNAEDPLFILYTSGSTGAPKGVLHTTGGFLAWCAWTHEVVFDYQEGEVYWCTADVGWVTGHSYSIYGPLANGATTLMFEGVPNYPDNSRFWEVIDKHQVNIFYTAPTAIRALMGAGEEAVRKTSRHSLRVLGSVGEPINPEAWLWYYRVVGEERCPIIDTWWQTETGGILICPLPGATPLKPGSATLPLPGVQPAIVNAEGQELEGVAEGELIIKGSWPAQVRTVWGDHKRFGETYFKQFPGAYCSGDGARRDADGYYWITGRVDDVINVSGHRLGTAEVESALVAHPAVAEAAVIGVPHAIKGQGLYAYITLMDGHEGEDGLAAELVQWVRREIGPIATLDHIQWTAQLPKTRSGKIMRRILRKIAAGEYSELGDTSTLANPEVVAVLIEAHQAG